MIQQSEKYKRIGPIYIDRRDFKHADDNISIKRLYFAATPDFEAFVGLISMTN